MSGKNPVGREKYWLDGAPVRTLVKGNKDGKSEKYWLDGAPLASLVPKSSSGYWLFF